MSSELFCLLKDQFACCMKLLNLISDEDKLEAVKHIEAVLVEFNKSYVGSVIKQEYDVKPDEQELDKFSNFGEYFEKDNHGDSAEEKDIKLDISELLMHAEIDMHKEIKTEGCFSDVQNTAHQKVTEQVKEHKVKISRSSGKLSLQKAEQKLTKTIDEQFNEEVSTDKESVSRYPKRDRSTGAPESVNSCLDMSPVKIGKRVKKHGALKASDLTYVADREKSERTSCQFTEKKDLSSKTFPSSISTNYDPNLCTHKVKLMSHACVVCRKTDFGGLISQRLRRVKEHYCAHFRSEILELFKNKIRGSTCLVEGCSTTISDTLETQPNIARHIGSAHNKIYEILKLRGHKLEFLKPKKEKLHIGTVRSIIGVRIPSKNKK